MKKFGIFFIFSIVAIAMSFSIGDYIEVAKADNLEKYFYGVSVNGGTYIMEGGELAPVVDDMWLTQDNSGVTDIGDGNQYNVFVGGVELNNGGKLEMRNGSIYARDYGVKINNGSLIMSGGKIYTNINDDAEYYYMNYGVYYSEQEARGNSEIFTMTGGEISGFDYGVYIETNSTKSDLTNNNINISCGKISNCYYGIYLQPYNIDMTIDNLEIEDCRWSVDAYAGSLDSFLTFNNCRITKTDIQYGCCFYTRIMVVKLNNCQFINENCRFDTAEMGDVYVNGGYFEVLNFEASDSKNVFLNGVEIVGASSGGVFSLPRLVLTNGAVLRDAYACDMCDGSSIDGTIRNINNSNIYGVCTMEGGEISGIETYLHIGTNSDDYAANFIINAGEIKNNNCIMFIHRNSTFTINGGKIYNNNPSGVEVQGTFVYNGGTLEDQLNISSGVIVLQKEPEVVMNIKAPATTSGTQIAKLDGISTINLLKIKVTNSNRVLTYKTISGEKWIVLGSTTSFMENGFEDPWNQEIEKDLELTLALESVEPSVEPIAFIEEKKQKFIFDEIYDNKKFYLEPVKRK